MSKALKDAVRRGVMRGLALGPNMADCTEPDGYDVTFLVDTVTAEVEKAMTPADEDAIENRRKTLALVDWATREEQMSAAGVIRTIDRTPRHNGWLEIGNLLADVTRVVVVHGERRREYDKQDWDGVGLVFQDEGRTLKVLPRGEMP